MRSVINRALARFDLALIKPSQVADDVLVRTITELKGAMKDLNMAIELLENDKLELGDKLLAMSRENEKPRCDHGCSNRIDALVEVAKHQQTTIQNLRSRVSYWKRKAGK